jgi:hypothetical protein
MRTLARLSVTALIAVAGCGIDNPGNDDPAFMTLTPDPSFPGSPGDPASRTHLFEFQAQPGCAVSNPTDLGGRTLLRIFRGPGVSDADVVEFFGGLQRYYSQYGVSFATAYEVIAVPTRRALILDMPLLSTRVEDETGVDINDTELDTLTPEQNDQVVASLGSAIMHNLRELLRVYAVPRRSEINVVLLPRMLQKPVPAGFEGLAGLMGLGVSPELLAALPADDPSRQLYDWLGAAGEFSPTAIVGVEPIRQVLSAPDVAMAHELGHAYGLAHVNEAGNLLQQGLTSCQVSLEASQLGQIQRVTSALTQAQGIESRSLTDRAADFVRAVRNLAPSRRRQ